MVKSTGTLGWGFLGTGSISDTVAGQALDAAGIVPLAVYGRDGVKASDFATRHGIEASFDNIDDLLAYPGVDAVYIALPHSLHLNAVLSALNAGKHVLCEKPFALDAGEVRSAMSAASDLTVAEGFMVRQHPQYVWIEQVLRSGQVGDIRHFLWSMSLGFPLPSQAPTLPGEGSVLLDIGSYPVHVSRMVFGDEPTTVGARASHDGDGRDVRFSAQLGFDGGVAQIMIDAHLPFASTVRIIGTEGVIDIMHPVHPGADGVALVRHTDAAGQMTEHRFGPASQYGLQFTELETCVASGSTPRCDLQNALGNAMCLDAIRTSMRDGGVLVRVERA